MRIILPFFTFIWIHLVLIAAAAESNSSSSAFKEICKHISTLKTCKTTLSLPDVDVITGKMDFFKWNSCKTKYHFFGGWTCIPGTDKTQIIGPTGVKVSWNKYKICDLARQKIPKYPDLMDRASNICKCVPQALEELDDQTTLTVFTSGNVEAGSAKVLQKSFALQNCYADAAMSVQDNKARLTQGQGPLVNKPGVLIFRAAELDTSRYMAFAVALDACYVGECGQIFGFLTNYLGDSEAAIKDQLSALFKPWTSAANLLSDGFDRMVSITSGVGRQIDEVEKDVKTLVADFCSTPTVCANNTLEALKKEVEKTLSVAKQIAELNAIVRTASTSIKEIGALISAASDSINTVSDLGVEGLVKQVRAAGSFGKIHNLANGLKAAQHLPQIIEDIKNQGGQLVNVTTQLQAKGPQFVDSIQKIVGQNWLSKYDQNDAAAAERLTRQVRQVQAHVARFVPQATQLFASASFLIDSLKSVSVQSDLNVQLDLGLASYSRRTSGSFDMPCLKTGSLKYNLFGFKGSVPYPKFYRCRQPYNIRLPNHHIPYLRLRIPDNALLARMGGNMPSGSTTSISIVSAQAQTATIAPSSTQSSNSSIATSITGGTSLSFSIVASTPLSSSTGTTETSTSTAEASSASSVVIATTLSSSTTSLLFSAVTASTAVGLPTSTAVETPTSAAFESPASAAVAPPLESALRPLIMPALTSTPIPTAAALRRDRSRPSHMRRQSAEDDPPDVIPPDETLSADLPSGFFTDTAQAAAAATETFASNLLFTSTTINGQATIVQVGVNPTGAPISTEVVPDPTLSDSTLSIPQTFVIATGLSTTSLEEDMTTWTPVQTVAVDTAEPTMEPTLTDSSSPSSTTQVAASATATTGTTSTSDRERVVGTCHFWVSFAVLLCLWLV